MERSPELVVKKQLCPPHDVYYTSFLWMPVVRPLSSSEADLSFLISVNGQLCPSRRHARRSVTGHFNDHGVIRPRGVIRILIPARAMEYLGHHSARFVARDIAGPRPADIGTARQAGKPSISPIAHWKLPPEYVRKHDARVGTDSLNFIPAGGDHE